MEGTGLEGRELESMGAQLGSDVPFFLRKGPCWCRGRGEIVEDAVVDSLEVLLLKPAFGVDTVDAYGRWAGSKKLPQVCYEPQQLGSFQMYNDLERPVFAKFLFLANLKMWQSLGVAIQFTINIYLGTHIATEAIVLLVCLGLSSLCLLVTHYRVANLDTGKLRSEVGMYDDLAR